ncbi:MAG: hypothetical protein V8S96_03545 [Lachnospiraceae bacterium]
MKSKTYEEFVEKFKPKKTTDDCYTPPEIYEVIKSWACKRYGIDPDKVVRPFWPGADYLTTEYPDGCVVIDNPPFSILSKICSFYLEREIPFFLFCPSLTAFSGKSIVQRTSHIICNCEIIYENGADVKTSFITSFDPEITAQTSPELTRLVNDVSKKIKTTRTLPKYDYPDYIVTAVMMQRYARYGVDFRVEREACMYISALDAQRATKKTIFGGGLLLAEKAAAEKAAAEKAAAEKAAAEKAAAERYALSERELDLVKKLGGESDEVQEKTGDGGSLPPDR